MRQDDATAFESGTPARARASSVPVVVRLAAQLHGTPSVAADPAPFTPPLALAASDGRGESGWERERQRREKRGRVVQLVWGVLAVGALAGSLFVIRH